MEEEKGGKGEQMVAKGRRLEKEVELKSKDGRKLEEEERAEEVRGVMLKIRGGVDEMAREKGKKREGGEELG